MARWTFSVIATALAHRARRLFRRVCVGLVCLGLVTPVLADDTPVPATPATLTVVSNDNYPPYVFRDEGGTPHGYLVDLWALWSQATGIAVKFESLPSAEARRRVLDGEADVIDAMFRTTDRETLYEFSAPYASVPVSIFTAQALDTPDSLAELAGTRVGVKAGEACAEHLQQHGSVRIVTFDTYRTLVAAAKAGEVSALCMNEALANYYFYLLDARHLFTKAFVLLQGRMHFAVRKGNADTLALVSTGMARIDKKELSALEAKWLGPSYGESPVLRNLGTVILVALAIGLVLAVWILALRNAVKTKTAELQREKASLHESEERFRRLFEDTIQPIALVEKGVYVAANKATLSLLGMTRLEQLIGRTPLDISPTALADGRICATEVPRIIEAAYANGALDFEWVHQRVDGELIDVRVMLTLIRIEQRDLLHVVWSDITARKRAETERAQMNALLEERVRLRTAELAQMTESLSLANREQQAIFDATTVGVMFVVKRQIMRCNRAMERLFGHSSEEMVGQSTRMLYPNQETFEAVGELVVEKLRTEGRFTEAMEMVRADGSLFSARLSAQRMAEDVPTAGYVAIIEDTTAERNAFRAMQKAKIMAEEATRLKSDFMANMSHEIRTPMTAILGMTQLALQEPLPPRQEAYLQKIQGAGKHLLSLLNDILDFSKIEAGKMIIEQVDFSLEDVLEGVRTITGEQAAAKGLAFDMTVAADVPACLVGDPVRIAQILTNYTTNAVKFTDVGRIDLRVEVLDRQAGDIDLRFSVRDTGCGLDAEQCARLFTSFQQGDSSTTRKHGGTGLGLAISKHLAEQMNGSVGVESTQGVGSEFWFCARLSEGSEAGARRRSTARHDPPQSHPAGLAALQVLLVEDNPLNQEVAQALLSHFGIQSTVADNGAIAVDMVQRQRFDVVLMDMQMPVMDGLAATRAIRALPGGASLPIIAMTANAMASDRANCLAAGMNDHLGKPIDVEQLIARIVKWTQLAAQAEPATGVGESPVSPAAADPGDTGDAPSGPALLDTGAGLRRSLNRTTLYGKTLHSFKTHFTGATEKMHAAIDADDAKALTLAAHSLKGAAGQIGADRLSQDALALEAAAKAQRDTPHLLACCATIAETMQLTLAAIDAFLESIEPPERRSAAH